MYHIYIVSVKSHDIIREFRQNQSTLTAGERNIELEKFESIFGKIFLIVMKIGNTKDE